MNDLFKILTITFQISMIVVFHKFNLHAFRLGRNDPKHYLQQKNYTITNILFIKKPQIYIFSCEALKFI